ncbi:MAG: hypothetical protein AABX02_02400 [archaeon]
MIDSTMVFRIARALPVKWQEWANENTRMAGKKTSGEKWLASTIIWGIIGAFAGAIGFWISLPVVNAWLVTIAPSVQLSEILSLALGLVIGFGVVVSFRWLRLYYTIEERRRKVEDILPDFLLLVAGNIRAGMTSFSAFKSSTRPEFGPLSEEVKSVTTRSLGTTSFGSALTAVSEYIRSKSL